MNDHPADTYVFPPLGPEAEAAMIEAAKAATAPRINRWQERLADRAARFCGSWTFIACFAAILTGWIFFNTLILSGMAFDPYPYTFLNLCLTIIMGLQGPLILMSQMRQNKQNRRESVSIYALALKAEAEGTLRGVEQARIAARLDEIAALLREGANSGSSPALGVITPIQEACAAIQAAIDRQTWREAVLAAIEKGGLTSSEIATGLEAARHAVDRWVSGHVEPPAILFPILGAKLIRLVETRSTRAPVPAEACA